MADIAGNLIANPSLETAAGSQPANWRTLKPASMRATFSYISSGFVGNRSAVVDVSRSNSGQEAQWFFDDVPVAPNTTYTFSNVYTANVSTALVVRYLLTDGSFQFGNRTSLSATSTPTTTNLQFTTPSNVQAVTVFHAISARGRLRTDEYSLVVSSADSTVPAVAIAGPAASATVSGTVLLSANATDNVGVRRVRFLVDGSPVGAELTSAPYQLSLDTRTLANGNHTVVAIAEDWAGNSSTSAAVAFTVQNDALAPSVAITSVVNGNVISGSWLFGATASDNVAVQSVQFLLNGVAIGPLLSGSPYQFVFDSKTVADGNHVLTARATDTSGNQANSAPVAIVVRNDQTAPTVSIIAPSPNASVSGTITIDASAQDNVGVSRVRFLVDGVQVGLATTSPYRFTFDTRTVADGNRTISAVAEDAAGNATTSAGVTIIVGNNVQPPPTSTNLFANGSLETVGTDGLPVGWVRDAWGTSTRQFVFPVPGSDGQNGARVEVTSWTSGDVKWHPAAVPVQPQATYTFQHSYRSDGETTLVAQFRLTSGVMQYARLATLGGTNAWVSTSHTFVVPNDVVAMTVFHVVARVGWLEVDDYSLMAGTPNEEPQPSTNLIANANLESPGASGNPLNWARGGWGTNNAQFSYPVAGRNGSSAARIDISSFNSGDAKWYFADVPVSPGQQLAFRNYYRSNATTQLVARYALASGQFQYAFLATLEPTTTWAPANATLVIPANVTSVTIFHNLYSAGWLEVDDYSLTRETSSGGQRGIVSLTFDDGWVSQFDNALPILQQAQLPATFYAVPGHSSNFTTDQRITNPSFEAINASNQPVGWTSNTTGNLSATFSSVNLRRHGARMARIEVGAYSSGEAAWTFNEVTVSPGQQLRLMFDYRTTAVTMAVVRYRQSNGQLITTELQPLTTGDAWQRVNQVITVPSNVTRLTAFAAVRGVGTILLDDFSLRPTIASGLQGYIDPSQILTMEQLGHEIGAHTRTHPSLPGLSTADALAEIAGSRSDLLNLGVERVDTFAYPFGDYNSSVRQMVVDSGFIGARGVQRGYNTANSDPYTLRIQQVDRTTTRAQVQEWINTAEQTGTWLVLMFHQIDYDQNAIYGNAPELLQDIVTDVKAANVDVLTMRAALERFGN